MSEDKKYDPQDKFGWPEGPDMVVYYDDAGNRISEREWMIKIGLEVPPLDTERDTEPGNREEYDAQDKFEYPEEWGQVEYRNESGKPMTSREFME